MTNESEITNENGMTVYAHTSSRGSLFGHRDASPQRIRISGSDSSLKTPFLFLDDRSDLVLIFPSLVCPQGYDGRGLRGG